MREVIVREREEATVCHLNTTPAFLISYDAIPVLTFEDVLTLIYKSSQNPLECAVHVLEVQYVYAH